MMRKKPWDNNEIYIGKEKVELDPKGEVHKPNFTVKTKGYPLLSGIITEPVTIKQEYKGSEFSGSVDDIIAACQSKGLKNS